MRQTPRRESRLVARDLYDHRIDHDERRHEIDGPAHADLVVALADRLHTDGRTRVKYEDGQQ